MTIEAVVYNNWPSGNPNLLHHRSFEGYCGNISQGAVRVELWVGQCSGGYVVVQFYPWFKFSFLLFLGMVMYDNEFETKENKI